MGSVTTHSRSYRVFRRKQAFDLYPICHCPSYMVEPKRRISSCQSEQVDFCSTIFLRPMAFDGRITALPGGGHQLLMGLAHCDRCGDPKGGNHMPLPAVVVSVATYLAQKFAKAFIDSIFQEPSDYVRLNEACIKQIGKAVGEKIEANELKKSNTDLKDVITTVSEYFTAPAQSGYRLESAELLSGNLTQHFSDDFGLPGHDSFHLAATLHLTVLEQQYKISKDVGLASIFLDREADFVERSSKFTQDFLDWHKKQCGPIQQKHLYTGTGDHEWLRKIQYFFDAYNKRHSLGDCMLARVTGNQIEKKRITERNTQNKTAALARADAKRQQIIDAYLQDLAGNYLNPAQQIRNKWETWRQEFFNSIPALSQKKLSKILLNRFPVKSSKVVTRRPIT